MSFSSVVIGVDFSHALRFGGAWVHVHIAPGARVTLVHAVDAAPVPSFLRPLFASASVSDTRQTDDALARVEAWRDQNNLHSARIVIDHGRPHEVLANVIREERADLVVLGAHSGSERPWQRVGSTTERLLRSAQASLLVVHGQPHDAPRRIVVGVDDVAITARVLAVAGEIADGSAASIHGIHVLSNAAYSHILSIEAAHSRTEQESRAKVAADIAEETLHWLTALAKNSTHPDRIEAEIGHGVPGDEILAAARRVSADLIVLGRYGIGRALPALLGSVVGTVVHGAECPVLVVAE